MSDRVLERLYDAADDYELPILDALLIKAGLRWNCLDAEGHVHWTNSETDVTCGSCGKARDKS